MELLLYVLIIANMGLLSLLILMIKVLPDSIIALMLQNKPLLVKFMLELVKEMSKKVPVETDIGMTSLLPKKLQPFAPFLMAFMSNKQTQTSNSSKPLPAKA